MDKRSTKRHINLLCTPGQICCLCMVSLTWPKLKGYSIGLLTMYITHTVGTAVSLLCYNLSTGKPSQSCRFNMCLCIIYKAHYNLAMFPLLDYATVQTWGNNIKFILSYCSKDVFKHSFLPIALNGWNALPVCSGGYILGTVQGQPPKCHILILHQTVFILHRVVVFLFCILNAHFPYYFSAHHVSLSVLTARDKW